MEGSIVSIICEGVGSRFEIIDALYLVVVERIEISLFAVELLSLGLWC